MTLIRPLSWEPPYAAGAAQEIAKRRQKKKKKKKERTGKANKWRRSNKRESPLGGEMVLTGKGHE